MQLHTHTALAFVSPNRCLPRCSRTQLQIYIYHTRNWLSPNERQSRKSRSQNMRTNNVKRKSINKIDMKTKRLGDPDLSITPTGFGAWTIGGSGWEFGWGEQKQKLP